jgi:CRP-like cAMP-binding protein
VRSGKLEVEKQTDFEGRQIIIAILERGAFVGELSLVDEPPRSATVTALEPSERVLLYREALEDLLQRYLQAGIAFLKGGQRIPSIRLRKAVDRIAEVFRGARATTLPDALCPIGHGTRRVARGPWQGGAIMW